MMYAVLGALAAPWAGCTTRAPPNYGATPQDHVDLGMAVGTGARAIPFTLRRANDSSTVALSELLKTKPVFLQFGAYT